MVPCENLHCLPVGMIIKDEVLIQIKEILLLADTPEHGFQRHTTFIVLGQALPLMKEFIFAAKCSNLCLHTVGEHKKCVVIEQKRNSILVICVVIRISILHIHIIPLQFYEQKRQAIYKAHDICPSAVKISVNLQLLNSKEMIIIRIIKVDYNGLLYFRLSVWLLNSHRNTITYHEILLFIDLK